MEALRRAARAAQGARGRRRRRRRYNDMVVKACALALREFPRANGAYKDGAFELHARVNVGVAVAGAGRARRADDLRRRPASRSGEIARETRALAERVRAGDDHAAGAQRRHVHGLEPRHVRRRRSFTAVINPPQAAILAVGALAPRAGRRATASSSRATHGRHARLRPPHPLRRRRRAVPRPHPRAARAAARAGALAAGRRDGVARAVERRPATASTGRPAAQTDGGVAAGRLTAWRAVRDVSTGTGAARVGARARDEGGRCVAAAGSRRAAGARGRRRHRAHHARGTEYSRALGAHWARGRRRAARARRPADAAIKPRGRGDAAARRRPGAGASSSPRPVRRAAPATRRRAAPPRPDTGASHRQAHARRRSSSADHESPAALRASASAPGVRAHAHSGAAVMSRSP